MNKTKKYLIISAIVFSFLSLALDIYDIVLYFKSYKATAPVFYVVFDFFSLFACLAVAVLLTIAIWGNGKYFRQRYSLYMSALIISIIINLLSISSILLVISMFVSDWVWIKEDKDKNVIIMPQENSKEEKIAALRAKRDRGEITNEEFQEELTKLL